MQSDSGLDTRLLKSKSPMLDDGWMDGREGPLSESVDMGYGLLKIRKMRVDYAVA